VPVLQFGDRDGATIGFRTTSRRGAGRDRIVRRARGTRLEDNAARRSCLMVDLVKSCTLNAIRHRRWLRRRSHRRDGFTVELSKPKLM
jgi:hypothetical protein